MIANLRGALGKDDVEGSFHDHTHNRCALLWPNHCCLTLPLWAERNDALKLTLSLSVREHLVDRDIVLLKEFEHGDLSRIASWVIDGFT